MQLKHLLLIVTIALSGVPGAQAQAPVVLLNDADRTFLREASQGSAFETIAGNLTVSHSDVAIVRKFGRLISRANLLEGTLARKLALRLGVPVSIEPSNDQKQQLSDLGKLFNGEFVRVFVDTEITTILNDIKSSLVVIRDGANPSVRAFARRRLVLLNQELQAAVITAQLSGLPLR